MPTQLWRACLASILGACLACDPVAQAIVADTSTDTVGEGSGGLAVDPDDRDGDGVRVMEDCNDYNAQVYPTAPEVFDGFDNDCDGNIDEDGADDPAFAGYGAVTRGGAGGGVVRVSNLANSGPGSLRAALETDTGPTIIEFDVAGEIVLESRLAIARPFITINGASAPAPGITLVLANEDVSFLVQGTHDVIVTHLRVVGPHIVGTPALGNAAALAIDAEAAPNNIASDIVFDHLTVVGAIGGGPDLWGEIRDVTISYCLVTGSRSGTSVSHFGRDTFFELRRISLHHNAWIGNELHNPQIRANVHDLHFVNNVVADWGGDDVEGMGLWIRAKPDEPKVDANIVANYFSADARPEWAVVFGDEPGPDDGDGGPANPASQGELVASQRLGALWVADNRLPDEAVDRFSTVTEPNAVPSEASVPRFEADTLGEATLRWVGARDRTDTEHARIDGVAGRIGP